jgi:hypothetical protein
MPKRNVPTPDGRGRFIPNPRGIESIAQERLGRPVTAFQLATLCHHFRKLVDRTTLHEACEGVLSMIDKDKWP